MKFNFKNNINYNKNTSQSAINNMSLRGQDYTFPRPLREKSALTPTLSHGRGSNSIRTDVSSRIAGEGLLKNVTSLPSYLPTLLPSKRAAFTLAEVLITLIIVGVVAAITLPPLVTNIQNQIKVKRVQNIKQKFSKATDKMLAMSGMNGYGSTENFVEELKHHLKIAKVCDNDHLNQCWGYEDVKLKNGKVWKISDTQKGENLKMKDSETEEWDDTIGIVTADGTSMILSYNKKCDMTTNINPKWDENQSSSADCVAAIFDWNGPKSPNMFDHSNDINIKKSDIMTLNSGGIGPYCAIEVNGKCFGRPFTANWTTGAQKCGGGENLPTPRDLEEIANLIYKTNKVTNGTSSVWRAADGAIAESLNLPNPNITSFPMWSNLVVNHNCNYGWRDFYSNRSEWHGDWYSGCSNVRYVVCSQ